MVFKFNNIPTDWKEGLLIGNGRLNAVVWGDQNADRMSLNHELLWTGRYGNRRVEERKEFLPLVRKFLKEGDYYRGTSLASLAFGGDGGISPYSRKEDMYLPAGDLVFYRNNGSDEKYVRTLDMEQGVSRIERGADVFEAFADCVTTLVYARWTSQHEIEGLLTYENEDENQGILSIGEQELRYRREVDRVCSYETVVKIRTDGLLEKKNGGLLVQKASYVECMINLGVSYKGIEQELSAKGFPQIWDFDQTAASHGKRFSEEMRKTSLVIEDDETERLQELYTNQRLERVRNGGQDSHLTAMFAEFGKYLFLSGSICAEMPLNLQGKWNCDPVPPWNCDYHFNINIQMNYWFAEIFNLGKQVRPLFSYVRRFAESGKDAAKKLYGCRGTWLSLNGDHWAVSTPEAYNYAAWIGGAAWISQHYWWHYQYGGDTGFLEKEAYPLFCDTADFYLDYIEIDETGTAQIIPSQSPENRFEGTGEFPVSFCVSSAMDVQLAYDAFTYAIESAEILGKDKEKQKQWKDMQDRLPPFSLGEDGRLLEWDSEEKQEVEKGHRHYSHLYGLFPSELFTRDEREAQCLAAGRSLDYRLSHDGIGSGWSRAWAACHYARLGKGNEAAEQIEYLLSRFSSESLLDLHPKPVRCKTRNPEESFVFQIDGNMGAARAVVECLIQSWGDKVTILPALPEHWKHGRMSGIRIKGGHCMDLEFQNGVVTHLSVVMGYAEKLILDNRTGLLGSEAELEVKAKAGTRVVLR